MASEKLNLKNVMVGFALVTLSLIAACGNEEKFDSSANTEFFTQSYNPAYLDVLWMIDNRSPMHRIQSRLVSETSSFFGRLDALTTTQYRMGIVDADMQFAQGALQPQGSSQILTKSTGTITDRTNLFSNLISQTINLQTGYADQGLDSALTALRSTFIPQSGVPLVIVFITDSDDHSTGFTGNDPVKYYADAFSAIKNKDPKMLRIYSVMYSNPTDNCATQYNIDNAGPTNRYYKLADAVGGQHVSVCGSFASQIDLTGLKTTTLPSTFALKLVPDASSIQVSVFDANTTYPDVKWSYDAASNSIVFTAPPPEGTTIQVIFNQQQS